MSVTADFLARKCAACGSKKPSRMSFCADCYWRLPREKRIALYRLFGDGYEEAYTLALKWLRWNGAKPK